MSSSSDLAAPNDRISVYFDLVSPYSWLALRALEPFSTKHNVRFEARPVVYAALLDAAGLVGPAESPSKRQYTFRDLRRLATLAGWPCQGPPSHPFRSIEALRAVALFRDRPKDALALAVALAAECWERGGDLTELSVIKAVTVDLGLDGSDLAERLVDPKTKTALRANTEQAVAAGVFGVPSFDFQGELFWGQDRLSHLEARIEGRIPPPGDKDKAMLERPRGADRKRWI